VSVILTVATNPSAPWNGDAPVAIGGFIFTAALTIGPSSGGSFNPARSIAPAVWAGDFGDVWIYIVGPLLGAFAAGVFALYLTRELEPAARDAR
jgi:glycerol uptake facilitator-like aquaporin